MRTHPLVVAAGLVVAGLGSHVAQGQTFVWIHAPQSQLGAAQARAMSSDGAAVAGSSCCNAHNGGGIGFVWRSSSGMSDTVFTWDTYQYTAVGPTGLAGTVRYNGGTQTSSFVTGAVNANFGNTGSGYPTGISDDGAVVIGTTTIGGPEQGYRWAQATGLVLLGMLPGATTSRPGGLSADGSVVVGQSGTFAFRWTAASGMVRLGPFPGGTSSAVLGITRDGGTIYGTATGAPGGLFKWTESTGMQPLTPAPPSNFLPGAVCDDGLVMIGALAGAPAFWRPDTGAVDLRAYLQAHGISFGGSNVRPTGFVGISSDGRTMAGNGDSGGTNNPWIATIPRCGSADFDCDGDIGTDADIEAFFACLSGTCPAPPCVATADFNYDGDTGTDADIEAFFRVLAGGTC